MTDGDLPSPLSAPPFPALPPPAARVPPSARRSPLFTTLGLLALAVVVVAAGGVAARFVGLQWESRLTRERPFMELLGPIDDKNPLRLTRTDNQSLQFYWATDEESAIRWAGGDEAAVSKCEGKSCGVTDKTVTVTRNGYLLAARLDFGVVEMPPAIPSRIVWSHVRLGVLEVSTSECGVAPEASEKVLCRRAFRMLGDVRVLREGDANELLGRIAEGLQNWLLPGVVALMAFVDAVLGFAFFGFLGAWWDWSKAKPVPGNDRSRALVSVDERFLAQKRILEMVETLGPALGFWLTATALLLAARSGDLFGDRRALSSALAMAMTATAAGLFMRVLAFSLERLLDYALRTRPDVRHGMIEED